ncbi:MAG TPA: PD-(D/E)XK nuclease family protein, partial [Usitatibacter sp.]|nr:PD-(D/E)XK nuclease family protein [Usitatibacter sp.]
MLAALPSIDRAALFDRLAAGEDGIAVVTSSRRLAQHLAASHDALRAARGARAWPSGDILPWRAFVDRLADDARHSDFAPGLPLALSTTQEQALWEECVRASHGGGLMSVPAAADAALQAWSLAHGWRLAAGLARAALHDDARAFVEWSVRYERITRERNQTDRARLPDVIAPLLGNDALRKPVRIVLAGFELITPQQAEFFERLRALGVGLESLAPCETEARPMRVSFASEDEELAAAARWARARIESGAARIGVIVPTLARSRRRVERIFMRAMDPGRGVATARSVLPFNISLGRPLAEWPACHDALGWLRLAGRDVAFEEASGLVRSPFVAGAEAEHAARAELDAAVRRRAAARVSLDALVRLVDADRMPRAPQLSERLHRLAEFR